MTALKTILTFSLLLLFVGCSTCPRPKIENGKYIHPEYQISFEIPPTLLWYQSEDLPERFIPKSGAWTSMLGAFRDVLFVTDRRNGAIALEIKKSWEDLGAKPPQRIEAKLEKLLTESKIGSVPFISNYKSKITAPYVCKTPLLLLHETCRLKNKDITYRCEIRSYVYTINKDDSCILRFILWSAPATYKENKVVLDNLVKSLERVYLPKTDS